MKYLKSIPTFLTTIVFLLAAVSTLTDFVSTTFALLMGLAWGLILGNPLITFTQIYSKHVLSWSIVGLGFGMNMSAVWLAGKNGFWLTSGTIAGVLLLGFCLGKLLKLDATTSILVSSGTAICGGSAIAAVGCTLNANAQSMSVSLCIVFILNAVALFLFPTIGHWFDLSQTQFGLWAAVAIHDTSSVVGAASIYGEEALEIATTVKLARALWIIPLVVVLACFYVPKTQHQLMSTTKRYRLRRQLARIPLFILFFLAAAATNTYLTQLQSLFSVIAIAAKHSLALALFLIGSNITRETLRDIGPKPMIQGLVLWVSISATTLAITIKS